MFPQVLVNNVEKILCSRSFKSAFASIFHVLLFRVFQELFNIGCLKIVDTISHLGCNVYFTKDFVGRNRIELYLPNLRSFLSRRPYSS